VSPCLTVRNDYWLEWRTVDKFMFDSARRIVFPSNQNGESFCSIDARLWREYNSLDVFNKIYSLNSKDAFWALDASWMEESISDNFAFSYHFLCTKRWRFDFLRCDQQCFSPIKFLVCNSLFMWYVILLLLRSSLDYFLNHTIAHLQLLHCFPLHFVFMSIYQIIRCLRYNIWYRQNKTYCAVVQVFGIYGWSVEMFLWTHFHLYLQDDRMRLTHAKYTHHV
jgi:hypothetical protein